MYEQTDLAGKVAKEIRKYEDAGCKVIYFCFSKATLHKLLKENYIPLMSCYYIFGVKVAANESNNNDYVLIEDPAKIHKKWMLIELDLNGRKKYGKNNK